ncbi:hypothetical protein LC612_35080 [Nostoc sp. CHAB 5834]|nr:hypothetical protein [Nostoc sp. CHAB 5834]
MYPSTMTNSWYERGKAAVAAVSAARYGERDELIAGLAATFGVAAQTLRREAAAVRFLRDDYDGPDELVTRLRLAPLASIEFIARWHRHDRQGALGAARQVADGKLSVRGIAQAELAARSSCSDQPSSDRRRDHVFRETVAASLAAIGGKVEAYAVGGFAIPFDLRWWVSPRWPVFVIIVGPYSDRDRYDARRVDWCLRADWHNRHSEALIVLAEPEALASYEGFRDQNRLKFDIVASTTGRFTITAGQDVRSFSPGSWSRTIVACEV